MFSYLLYTWLLACGLTSLTAFGERLHGAGPTYADYLMKGMILAYQQVEPDTEIVWTTDDFQECREHVIDESLDFCISAAPFTDAQRQANPNIINLPTAVTASAIVFNIPYLNSTTAITLDAELAAGIFSGNITMWHDPRILNDNPQVALVVPVYMPIFVIVDNQPEGQTYVFTEALSAMSEAWKNEVGAGSVVAWPTRSQFLFARNNAELISLLSATPYSIGYASYRDAATNSKVTIARFKNRAGAVVVPSDATLTRAVLEKGQGYTPGVYVASLVDGASPDAWPFTNYQYLLFRLDTDVLAMVPCPDRAAFVRFWKWAYGNPVSGGIRAYTLTVSIPDVFAAHFENALYGIRCGADHGLVVVNPLISQLVIGTPLLSPLFQIFSAGYLTVDPAASFGFVGIPYQIQVIETLLVSPAAAFGTFTHSAQVDYFVFWQYRSQVLHQPVDIDFSINRLFNPFGLAIFPYLLTPLLPAFNIPSIPSSQRFILDVVTIIRIYLGQVQYLDDPAILALNPHLVPGTQLPHQNLTVVVSSPNVVISELTRILPDAFQKFMGYSFDIGVPNPMVSGLFNDTYWPAPHQIATWSDDVVYSTILKTPNSFGVCMTPLDMHVDFAMLKNRAGNVISEPTRENQQACTNGLAYDELSDANRPLFASQDPQCWGLTLLESFMIKTHFTGESCAAGIKSVNYLQWLLSEIDKVPFDFPSYARLPDQFTANIGQVVNSITCDGISVAAPVRLNENSDEVVQGMNALTGVGLAIAAITGIGLFVFRDTREMRRASRGLLTGMLMGAFLCYIFPVVRVVQPPTDVSCTAQLFLVAYGYSLLLGCMFVKTWRVARIFANKSFQIVSISDVALWMVVLGLLAIDTVILVCWVVLDGFTARDSVTAYNPAAPQQFVTTMCHGGEMRVTFSVIMGVYKALVMVSGLVVTFRARNIHADFNERSYVLAASYNVLVTCLLALPLGVLSDDNVSLTLSVACFWATTGVVVCIFWPKLFRLTCQNWRGMFGSIFTFYSDLSVLSQLKEEDLVHEGRLRNIIQEYSARLKKVVANERQDQALGLDGNKVTDHGMPGTPGTPAAIGMNGLGRTISVANGTNNHRTHITGSESDLRRYITLLEARITQLEGEHHEKRIRNAFRRKSKSTHKKDSANNSLHDDNTGTPGGTTVGTVMAMVTPTMGHNSLKQTPETEDRTLKANGGGGTPAKQSPSSSPSGQTRTLGGAGSGSRGSPQNSTRPSRISESAGPDEVISIPPSKTINAMEVIDERDESQSADIDVKQLPQLIIPK